MTTTKKKLTTLVISAMMILSLCIGLLPMFSLTASAAEEEPTPVPCVTCATEGVNYDSNGFCVNVDGETHYQAATLNTSGTDDTADDYYEIGNAGQLYWFAEQVNGGNAAINGKLTVDINLNPGYTFEFEADTGLVMIKKSNAIVAYLGTGIKGDATSTNTVFDETASLAGAVYADGFDATADEVDLSDIRSWTPIGNYDDITNKEIKYNGIFDGSTFSVDGLYFNDGSDVYVGLFGYVDTNGDVRGITIKNNYIYGNRYIVGALSGRNDGKIENCCNAGTIIGKDWAGGIVGINFGSVENCYNTGKITSTEGTSGTGGIVGLGSSGSIKNCYNTGTVVGVKNGGGIVASNNCTVENCYNTGTVTASASVSYVGGIVGRSDTGDIRNCYNTGDVSATAKSNANVGGIGGLTGKVQMCYNTGKINATSDNVARAGGISGVSMNIVQNCYNVGSITSVSTNNSNAIAGGIVGYGESEKASTEKNCFNAGSIQATSGYPEYIRIGGIVGAYFGTVQKQNCYYLSDSETDKFDGTTAITSEGFASGAIAYILNVGQDETVWYQTVGTDATPTLDDTRNTVAINDIVFDELDEQVLSATIVELQADLADAVVAIQGEGFNGESLASLAKAIKEANDALTALKGGNNTDTIASLRTSINNAISEYTQKINDLEKAIKGEEYIDGTTLASLYAALGVAEDAIDAIEGTETDEATANTLVGLRKAIDAASATLGQKIADLEADLADAEKELKAKDEELAAKDVALEKADADNKAALEKVIADAKAALEAKDTELAKADADNKAALEAKDAEIEAKNASQQTFIIIVCVIAGLAFAGCGTLGALFFLDKKKRRK